MTSKDDVPHFRVLRAIGLCGTLAFLISVASPADDEVQQECLAGRTRQHTVRLLKVASPGATARRIAPAKALPVTCFQRHPATNTTSIAIDVLQLPGAILAHQTGDRSPPAELL